ncbi:MAG: hypothetical protein ACE5G8_15960, partial [Anaerolineae bacterium]
GQYSRNLTLLAHRSQITPTGSFEDEQMELIRVLNRPAANNPLLLTETKTQGQEVVHDLAWQFIHGVVPPALGKRRILELNLDQLSTNINYQGHFAHRVQEVLKEVMEEPDVILFIARIETLIGSGSIHVDMADVSQLMADALERGKIQCIGATTSKEYKAYISLKEELNRHFQPIVLGEHPPAADAPPEAPPVQPVKASEPLNWSPGAKQPETGAGVRSALGRVEKRLGRFGLQLQVSPAALAFLARQPGGRQRTTPAIEAAISQHIENPLGAMLLRGEVDHGQTIAVDVAGNQLVIKVAGK